MKRFGKLLLVMCGALVVTALGIDAADTLTGKEGTMLARLVPTTGTCPAGMVEMVAATTFTCVDRFEATPSDACEYIAPKNEFETVANLSIDSCQAASKEGDVPWRFVTREQAQVACARAGKRLPSALEWYQFALGTPDEPTRCNITGNTVRANAANSTCVSAVGIHNGVGNVWEWVTDDVIGGMYNARSIPEEGYVSQVDQGGVAITTKDGKAPEGFGDDYFWSSREGAYGMLRGGFYGSGEDAGVYAVLARSAPTFLGEAIGFRCVR